MSTPTERQMNVLLAACRREAGGDWTIDRVDGLDCIDRGRLTEDYYLTDVAKKLLEFIPIQLQRVRLSESDRKM